MRSLFDYIKQPVASFMQDFGPIHYEAPPSKYSISDVPNFVPEQYRNNIANAANLYDFDVKKASALLNTENTPWDPTLKNPKKDSTALGLGQHTDAFYIDYNKKFQDSYGGRNYDRTNPYDSISATFLALSDIRKRLEGTDDDAIKAYHIGIKGYTDPDQQYTQSKKEAETYYHKVMSHLLPK